LTGQLETSFGKKSSVASVPKTEQKWLITALVYMYVKEVLPDRLAIVYFLVVFGAFPFLYPYGMVQRNMDMDSVNLLNIKYFDITQII